MAATIRTAIGIAIGLFLLYWLFVIVARSVLNVDIPDPADLMPDYVKRALPYR